MPGTQLASYLAEIKDLVQRLNLTEESVRDAFFRGLPDRLKTILSLGNFPDFRSLYNKVQECIETNSPFNEDSSLGMPMTFAVVQMDAKIDRMANKLSDQIQSLNQKNSLESVQPREP